MAPNYYEHPSKAARWEGEVLSVLPESEEADTTVWCGLPDDEGWEGLLAKRDGDTATICAVPVYAYDLHLGDVVGVMESAEGAPVVAGPVRPGGNITFRARIRDTSATDPWLQLLHRMRPLKCVFDVYSPRLIAISTAEATAQSVAAFLANEEAAGMLDYETGSS